MSASICGVILAAGFSTRMGRDKALLPWPPVGEGTPVANTFLGATIDVLQPVTDLVIVVAGKNAATIGPVTYAHGAFLVVNPTPELGQFSSLRVGVREVLNHGRDAAFLALTDRPPVLPATLQKLRDAFLNADPEIWAVIPAVQRGAERVHGHPILVGREMIEAFLRAPLDGTARELEHQHQQHIEYVPVEDGRTVANIDTIEDYERLSQSDMISSEKQF
ncbi:MAG: nucleotidyltransferase family protein [Candidatus Korobacteraceae bacterium]